MFTKDQRVEAGEHTAEFRFKLGQAFRYNACFFLCKFKTPDGKDWPWDYRGGSLSVAPEIHAQDHVVRRVTGHKGERGTIVYAASVSGCADRDGQHEHKRQEER